VTTREKGEAPIPSDSSPVFKWDAVFDEHDLVVASNEECVFDVSGHD
jgi:hypothetical protein